LLRCIHRGETPDIALFYGGLDDAFSSYQNGVASLVRTQLQQRRLEFSLHDQPQRLLPALWHSLLRYSGDSNLWQ